MREVILLLGQPQKTVRKNLKTLRPKCLEISNLLLNILLKYFSFENILVKFLSDLYYLWDHFIFWQVSIFNKLFKIFGQLYLHRRSQCTKILSVHHLTVPNIIELILKLHVIKPIINTKIKEFLCYWKENRKQRNSTQKM